MQRAMEPIPPGIGTTQLAHLGQGEAETILRGGNERQGASL